MWRLSSSACVTCTSNSVSSASETEVDIYSTSKGRTHTLGFICTPSWQPVFLACGEPLQPSWLLTFQGSPKGACWFRTLLWCIEDAKNGIPLPGR